MLSDHKSNSHAAGNPYLHAKVLWDDVYGGVERKLRISQRFNGICLLIIVVAVIGLALSVQKIRIKPVPFIVHGDEILTISDQASVEFDSVKRKLAHQLVKKFIVHSRTVSLDPSVNRLHLLSVFSMVTHNATTVLEAFYKKRQSLIQSHQQQKHITITSVLEEAPHVLSVRWKEDSQSGRRGEDVRTKHYIAEVTYRFLEPSHQPRVQRHNPLGFYITHLTWSRDLDFTKGSLS